MMKATLSLLLPTARIADFCRHWQVAEFALFGSVLRDDFGPASDIDVLVTFQPQARRSLFELLAMERELAALFGRKVDLVDRRVLEQSENWIRRKHILDTAEVVYGA